MPLSAVWLHLRLPFSIYLLPIYLFAVSQSPAPDWGRVLFVGFVIHVLMYPAANTYNSYFDKDEGSVNGLEAPPPVDRTLLYVSLGLQAGALLLGLLVNYQFVVFIAVYGLIMMAYSDDRVRLKKYPVTSWLVISALQGGFTYLMCYVSLNNLPLSTLTQPRPLLAGLIATGNLLALYPMTQVYQHEEDARRGDMTFSRLLGVRGTFVCALLFLLLSGLGFWFFYRGETPFYLLLLFMTPTTGFFLSWLRRVWTDPQRVDFRSANRLTQLTGWGMNAYFLTLLLLDLGQPL